MTSPDTLRVGDRVQLIPHSSWNAEYQRLIKSGRVGVVAKTFTPLGGSPVCRVVFPKEGRYKERTEFFRPVIRRLGLIRKAKGRAAATAFRVDGRGSRLDLASWV